MALQAQCADDEEEKPTGKDRSFAVGEAGRDLPTLEDEDEVNEAPDKLLMNRASLFCRRVRLEDLQMETCTIAVGGSYGSTDLEDNTPWHVTII